MPIYEYQCTNCEHKMEALRKISDSPLVDCPACEKPSLNKLVSSVSFRLKGGGWYETDFKTGNKKQLAESESASSGSSGGSKSGEDKPSSTASASKGEAKATGSKDGAKSSTKQKSKPSTKAPSS